MTNNISFKSRIRAVTDGEFERIVSTMGRKSSDYPWTVKQKVIARDAFTRGAFDCSVISITDGNKARLYHLCATNTDNNDFNKIKENILNDIDISNPYNQVVVIGSQDNNPTSKAFNEKIINFFKSLKMPTSLIKNSTDYFNMAYSSITDEYCINSKLINKLLNTKKYSSEEVLKKTFKTISLSEFA